MAHLFGDSFKKDMLLDRLEITPDDEARLYRLADRRIGGEPLQYILGRWEFYGYDFAVGEGVLIPRQDTEALVENAYKLIKDTEAPKVVDLCSGTGCIPIVLSKLKAGEYTAVERFDGAYNYLCQNIQAHGGVKPILGDVLDESLADSFCGIDLITANPPYLTGEDMISLQLEVKHEPRTALYGGDDGLHFYREISRIWKGSLKSGGHIIFEIGLGQEEDVAYILRHEGYINIHLLQDLTSRVRCVSAECP